MANSFKSATNVWVVTDTAGFSVDSTMNPVVVAEVIYVPSAVADDLVFQDGDASEDAIVLKAGTSDASPIHKSFRPQGKRINNLTCTTIDGGTAYVYFL